MVGELISHYRVLDQLGSGGMGVVYRAQDLRLGRTVALKVLAPALSAQPAALERFRREADALAALNHPHICTLHDVGEHEGRQYLVFELIDGRSLKDVLASGPLSPDRAIDLAMQVADALDAAHAKGIVHRDIKPANIQITSRGDAKLLDFGIARPITGALTPDAALTRAPVTMPGEWIGTPDYMAPEQIRGDPPDGRSDVFAFGAVLFEMVTGKSAFAGRTTGAALEAVLTKPAPSVRSTTSHVPEELERIILKALEKDPSFRYQSARELLADLRRLKRASDQGPVTTTAAPQRRRAPSPLTIGVLGVVVVAVLGAFYLWVATRPDESTPPVALANGEMTRLAVLPFENLTRRPEDDWLAGAFSDSISAALQPISTLVLVPRERVVELYGAESRRDPDPLSSELARELSRQLRVRWYVHGSYQRVGEQLRVNARLVDVDADAVREQASATGEVRSVLQLEDALGAQLAARWNPDVKVPARTDAAPDLEAYQLVTEARALYALSDLAAAQPLLERAAQRAPGYAQAWALLSKTHSRMVSPASASGRPNPGLVQLALREAETAVRLAPTLVESHTALAQAYRSFQQRDLVLAAAEHAATLDPRNGEARILMGDARSISPGFGCPTTADAEQAEKNFLEGLRLDPLGTGYLNLTTLRWWMNRPVEALAALDEGLSYQPKQRLLLISRPFNLVFADRLDEAEALLTARATTPMSTSSTDVLTPGFIALRRGRFDAAGERFASPAAQHALDNLAWNLITTVAHFAAGRTDVAAGLLARAIKAEPECADWATQVPALAPYRDLPQFRAALRTKVK